MLHSYLRRTGFRRQLTILSSIALIGLAISSSLMSSSVARRYLSGSFIEQGMRQATNLAQQSRALAGGQLAPFAHDAVLATLSFPNVLRVEVSNAAHQPLLVEAKQQAADVMRKLGPSQYLPLAELPAARLERENDDAWLFVAPITGAPVDGADESFAGPRQLRGHLHMLVAKTALNRLLNVLLLINLGVALSFAVLLLWLLRSTVHRTMAPLNALAQLMRRAEQGHDTVRAIPQGPQDIAEMAHAFNKMMGVLEERDAALRRSHDEALRNARLKSQFAATISHEVRTPLNGVVGMLELLKGMQLTPRQQDCVDIAWSSSQALNALVNDVLDFSKMEAGKLTLDERDFNLRALVEELLTLQARPAQQKNLALGYLMDGDVPEIINGDALRLRQVLLNLLGNAIKFTERGEVALRISFLGDAMPVAGDGAATPFGLRFEVSDTGIGMTAETIAAAFESYVQADRSTTRRFGGTGLGLPICRQLVQLMSGEIGIVSERGRGSTFWFTIRGTTGAAPAPRPPAPVLPARHAMLIGGAGIVRDFLHQHLSELDMQCTFAVTHADAVRELMRLESAPHAYHLLVMEIDNATSAGAELVRSLRADGQAQAPRLLLLDRYGNGVETNLAQYEAILEKPLRRDGLHDAVARLLRDDPAVASAAPAAAAAALPLRRILIAEDNRTNQMVAAGMLTISGCHCEFAATGAEAVAAARDRQFDLILMDCNMPEMDGYEATAHIRSFEEGGGRRTPIIAMTANTQSGDAEKCLWAGMDDYLSKPITLIEVRQKLERWLAAPGTHPPQAPAGEEPLDLAVFEKLRLVLGATLPEALLPFMEDTQTYIARLEHALAQDDAATVRAQAHAIKGSSSNLGAARLARLARDIEDLAALGALEQVALLTPQLRPAFDTLAQALKKQVTRDAAAHVRHTQERPLVLVVEDDRSTRSALRHTLQREGFRVEEAEDGEQALALLIHLQPDVILMDAMMPVMDGFTACARLQEMPSTRTIPVLMITALDDNVSVERAFAAGASDYIPKPIHFAVLSQRVRRIIDGSRAEKRIRHLANNDLLTNLPNRAMFTDRVTLALESALQRAETLAVLLLDLDRFKNFNDTLGHAIGDQLLVAVGERMQQVAREADCVARLGGDEFALLMPDVGQGHAAATAEHISRMLAKPFAIDGHDIFVTASIGVSLYPGDGDDAGTLLKHADTAMYRAKRNRTAVQFFEAAMEQSISERMRMENDLRHALERGELEVHYQPQASLVSGRVVGMEALVRWRHPQRGMVAPAEFIPLAEETGLIVALGIWVLHTACAQVQAWVADGAGELKVAVNLSVRQLLQHDFTAAVEEVLLDTGLAPHLLELEITESTLMEHAEDTLAALNRLRALGIRLSIDDFGTGYSSLAYLKRFPVDVIKIDRSFVRDVCEDADDAAIVGGIIVLAHSLRLEVVAEGVETAAQLAFLREKSCDLMQGYYLSAALPPAQFLQLIAQDTTLAAADAEAVLKVGTPPA